MRSPESALVRGSVASPASSGSSQPSQVRNVAPTVITERGVPSGQLSMCRHARRIGAADRRTARPGGPVQIIQICIRSGLVAVGTLSPRHAARRVENWAGDGAGVVLDRLLIERIDFGRLRSSLAEESPWPPRLAR